MNYNELFVGRKAMGITMHIDEKYCKTLELDKILMKLADFTCCDEARKRALNIKPFVNESVVKDEITKTNDAFLLSSKYGTPSFSNLANPDESLQIAQKGGLLTLRAFLNINAVLRQTRLLCEWYKQCEGINNSLKGIFSLLEPNKALEEKISSVVISEDAVSDYASAEIASIRRNIVATEAKAKSNMEKIIRSATYQKALQDAIVTIRNGRFVVPVKVEHKSEVPGLVHDTSASGATLYIEPMSVVEANNEIKVLKLKEKAEIERILYELSALCGENSENIKSNFDVIISLNIYFAKSSLAADMKAMMPEITSNSEVLLNKARHPLIDKDKVVPISVSLGSEYKTLVVTGPNTGGKTVTLKTIGLLTLMTMCGMLIPVSDGSKVSVFDKVLVDIGDEQSIEQSLSTFSAHMTNIVSILDKADNKSLILLDELGSGTDPVEGAALAIAILQRLKALQSTVAATTHYSELKIYAIETDGVENACCEFDLKTLRPTYKLLIGIPGKSNAFEISKRLGLDGSILEYAGGLISSQDKKLEKVIDNLEASRQEYEQKLSEYNKKVYEYKNRTQIIEEEKKKLAEERDNILKKAKDEAQRLVEKVTVDSQNLMDELEKLKKQKDSEEFSKNVITSRAQLRGKINALHNEANPVDEKKNKGYKLPRALKKGDNVLIVDIDKKAVVLQTDAKSDTVMVQAGIIKTRVKLSNLRLLENEPSYTVSGKVVKNVTKKVDRHSVAELDIRGKTADEAILELDMFIDNAVMGNIDTITIIHGKGTGVLRKAVGEHLKYHSSIKDYRLGTFGEGENGVTIATLK